MDTPMYIHPYGISIFRRILHSFDRTRVQNEWLNLLNNTNNNANNANVAQIFNFNNTSWHSALIYPILNKIRQLYLTTYLKNKLVPIWDCIIYTNFVNEIINFLTNPIDQNLINNTINSSNASNTNNFVNSQNNINNI